MARESGVEFRVNHEPSLPRFAELNRQWIERYHHMECGDREMVADPGVYLRNGGRVITAHVGGEVAGAVALKPHDDGPNGERKWELTKMAVDPRFHGRGIGGELLEEAHRVARDELGLSELFLLTNTKLEAAGRLYARHGWVVNHEGAHPVYERCNIGYRKTL